MLPAAATHKPLDSTHRRWWWDWEFAALGLLVLAIYFTRLAAVPVCGEESRWATAAREMIASGDLVVPRQQGEMFAERPPLGTWAMALVGLVRGRVDLVAIRLPSALAMLATVWLIYGYTRSWASRLAGLAAAASYATFGQVLILGRFGESEALFTLWTASALLVWHAGYLRGWSPTITWSAGYGLAALGALTKGPQAPFYFAGTCLVFLLVRRDWRWLVSAGHLAGLATFALVVGLWFVPFAQHGPQAIDDIWTGLASDRFTTDGLLTHLAVYPLETAACWLPWTPLLLALCKRSVRQAIWTNRPQVQFLLVALAVTYPTVWLAAGARGRYFMPLYPCVAVIMGLVVEHCTTAGVLRADFALWRRFLRGTCITVSCGGLALVLVSTVNVEPFSQFSEARQSAAFVAIWLIAAVATLAALVWASYARTAPRPQAGLLSIAMFTGLAAAGAVVNARIESGNDLTPAMAEIKRQLAESGDLVSLGRVYHRFTYSYDAPIRQVPWPTSADALPAGATYFCFDRRPGDTAEDRAGNDDRLGAHTTGTLPFAWEQVADIPCDPVQRKQPHRRVIIGRVLRDSTVLPGSVATGPAASQPARR